MENLCHATNEQHQRGTTAIDKDRKEAFCLPKPGHIEPNDSNKFHLRLHGQNNNRIHATEISILRPVFEDINLSPGSRGF
jgi:hypothetical protein